VKTAPALLPLALMFSFAASAQTLADRAAITAAIGRWDRAWQVKDAELATHDYAATTHWVNAFGQRASSRAEVRRTLREVFALPFVVAGNSRTLGHEVRFLNKDVATVATRVERVGQQTVDSREMRPRHTSHLRVFQRQGGRWQITSHLISDARDRRAPAH
jgi:uncharacterized protein (TIGR02246 family)